MLEWTAVTRQHLLLGTAGHIDHGKTALIRALTGVDCDRLPDEKRREITIDLGFASLELGDYLLGVVDVPGHERFIKNMLAGATGIDLALLVVAVDDAVKPQTREHLEILEHLQLPAGVIALTKCDLADDDWIDLVEEEVRELVAGTFLATAQIVRVSAKTELGLEQLRDELLGAAHQADAKRQQRRHAPFRMAVDRAFSLPGHGAIVTGSIASGQLAVGDPLELQPSGAAVRVRGLQSHDTASETLAAGQRAAVNLGGIHYDEVERGDVLSRPGLLRASQLVAGELKVSEQIARPLRSRSRVRFHLGTTEAAAVVRIAGRDELLPGETAFVQFILADKVAGCWGQPFVVRSESPMELLGGGRIIDPWAQRLKRPTDDDLQRLQDLSEGDARQRTAAAAYFRNTQPWSPDDLFVLAGVSADDRAEAPLAENKALERLTMPNGDVQWMHRDVADRLSTKIVRLLTVEHQRTPLAPAVEVSRLTRYFSEATPPLLAAVLEELDRRNTLNKSASGVALTDWSPQLSARQEAVAAAAIDALRAGGLQPPGIPQLASDADCPPAEFATIIDWAVHAAQLVRISADVVLTADVYRGAVDEVTRALAEQQQMTVSEIRELLGANRRVVVPLCEHLDAIGLTERVGDHRRLTVAPPSASPI